MKWTELHIAFNVLVKLLISKLLLISLSFENLKKWVEILSKRLSGNNKELQLSYLKKWSGKFPSFFSCLPAAIATRFIVDNKEKPTIHFGVQNTGSFEAHAWVEISGKIILGERKTDNFKTIWTWE